MHGEEVKTKHTNMGMGGLMVDWNYWLKEAEAVQAATRLRLMEMEIAEGCG